MKKILLAVFILSITPALKAQDISGDWKGVLEAQGSTLEVAFHIKREGTLYKTTLDIPKQALTNWPVETTSFSDSLLALSMPQFKAEYQGKLNAANDIEGYWAQGGTKFKLKLTRGNIVMNRPQEPKPPFKYHTEEVVFHNGKDKIQLAGTLSLPKKEGRYPVAIIISGSGPQNRDGDMFGHKPYLLIADELTKSGIAVLRFDDRGVGKSGGTVASTSISTTINDVTAALNYLKTRKEVEPKKIGLIGHSIGGIVAPKLASENKDVSWVIMLAGPGMNGDELMLLQKATYERMLGIDEKQIGVGQQLLGGAYKIIRSGLDTSLLKDSLDAYFRRQPEMLMMPEEQRKALIGQITGSEVLSLLQTTPAEYLKKVKVPVLALNGSKDFQVPAKANLAAIKTAIESGGNKKLKTVELENLNHLFQESKTGNVSEYTEIEQTFSPRALQQMVEWIKGVT